MTCLGRAKNLSLAMVGLLMCQFLLGMVVNLFVSIPLHHPGSRSQSFSGVGRAIAWVIPNGAVALSAHVILAFALVLISARHLQVTTSAGRRRWTVLSTVGVVALLGAAFNGLNFLNEGDNASSMTMTVLFGVALTCYAVCGFQVAVAIAANGKGEPSAAAAWMG